jgi:putative hemolysin
VAGHQRSQSRSGHSRLPVADGDLDRVLGVVRTSDLLAQLLDGAQVDPQELVLAPAFIPESASPAQAVVQFRRTRMHMLFVVDEFGGVAGLATPTDVLEFMVGHLPTLELAEPAIGQREDGSWLVDGLVSVHELAAVPYADQLLRTISPQIQTLNGLLMQQLGHIPSAGESFELDGLRFEVVDMDGKRVDKVLVSPIPEGSIEPTGEE